MTAPEVKGGVGETASKHVAHFYLPGHLKTGLLLSATVEQHDGDSLKVWKLLDVENQVLLEIGLDVYVEAMPGRGLMRQQLALGRIQKLDRNAGTFEAEADPGQPLVSWFFR